MNNPQMNAETAPQGRSAVMIDLKLEVVVIPVSDVDRAKRFYGSLGWRPDADFAFDSGFRVVQFTPPGSACSVQFGAKMTSAAPGSAQGNYLIVSDIQAARDELVARGVKISEVFHAGTPGAQFQPDGTNGRVRGPAPDHATYRSFATFNDPDGNGWLLQEITTRLPGRGLSNMDVATLTELLRETEKRHGEYEPTAPKHHWSGGTPPTLSHARAAGRPTMQRRMPRSIWKGLADEGRHRPRRSPSGLRAFGPPRQAQEAVEVAGKRSAGGRVVLRRFWAEREEAARLLQLLVLAELD